ncbi:MAG: hypothetical protein ACR2HC_07115 [Thermoleophilaceae bacterium]
MTIKQYASLMGFAFVAAAFGLGIGAALVCVVGAALAYGAAAVAVGELDAEEIRERVEGARSGFQQPERKNPPR